MADRKIPSLNAIDTPVDDDLLLIVDDATSSPVNKKVSLSSLFKNYVRSVDTVDKSQTRKELNLDEMLELEMKLLLINQFQFLFQV